MTIERLDTTIKEKISERDLLCTKEANLKESAQTMSNKMEGKKKYIQSKKIETNRQR
jgi:hypothetical protein